MALLTSSELSLKYQEKVRGSVMKLKCVRMGTMKCHGCDLFTDCGQFLYGGWLARVYCEKCLMASVRAMNVASIPIEHPDGSTYRLRVQP